MFRGSETKKGRSGKCRFFILHQDYCFNPFWHLSKNVTKLAAMRCECKSIIILLMSSVMVVYFGRWFVFNLKMQGVPFYLRNSWTLVICFQDFNSRLITTTCGRCIDCGKKCKSDLQIRLDRLISWELKEKYVLYFTMCESVHVYRSMF